MTLIESYSYGDDNILPVSIANCTAKASRLSAIYCVLFMSFVLSCKSLWSSRNIWKRLRVMRCGRPFADAGRSGRRSSIPFESDGAQR